MKTDPFDDAIRRKLEGVNPPFQEKSWTHFQHFMGSQGFPPSLWQTPVRWLQPALMAAAVAGVVLTTVWQYRTTQSLTEHVQTLTKTVERLEQSQLRLQQAVAAQTTVSRRLDTVYVAMPGRLPATRSADEGRALTLAYSRSGSAAPNSRPALMPDLPVSLAPSSRSAQPVNGGEATRLPTRTAPQLRQPAPRLAAEQAADHSQTLPHSPAVNGEPVLVDRPPALPTNRLSDDGQTHFSANSVAKDQYRSAPEEAVPIAAGASRSGTGRTAPASSLNRSATPVTSSSRSTSPLPDDENLYVYPVDQSIAPAASAVVNPAVTALGSLAAIQFLSLRTSSGSADALAESWQRHLRRVRYRSPYATSLEQPVAAAPSSPDQHTTPLPLTFRVGAGGEFGTTQSGAGVFVEAIVANHWTIGTGLGQMTWAGDRFPTEQLFMAQTKHDFRNDYPTNPPPMPMGPGRVPRFMDISRVGQSLVIPVQVGYRVGLGNHYVLTPSLGINLGINPRETVTYAYDLYGPRDNTRETLLVKRPPDWYSNWVVSLGAERQWGHVTAQISPVILLPLSRVDACLNTASVGLRGRLFYRF